jgi:hypothetical protein
MASARRVGACAVPVIRGLNRVQAAAYIGVSPSLFDQMVADGRMPKAKAINARTVWGRLAVDRAFDLLPGGDVEGDGDDWTPEV